MSYFSLSLVCNAIFMTQMSVKWISAKISKSYFLVSNITDLQKDCYHENFAPCLFFVDSWHFSRKQLNNLKCLNSNNWSSKWSFTAKRTRKFQFSALRSISGMIETNISFPWNGLRLVRNESLNHGQLATFYDFATIWISSEIFGIFVENVIFASIHFQEPTSQNEWMIGGEWAK